MQIFHILNAQFSMANDVFSLAFAFEIHYIASTREKRQEIKETHAGLASFKTLTRIRAFKQILGVNCVYIIMGNPVDITASYQHVFRE
jgi:hypothetical protein